MDGRSYSAILDEQFRLDVILGGLLAILARCSRLELHFSGLNDEFPGFGHEIVRFIALLLPFFGADFGGVRAFLRIKPSS